MAAASQTNAVNGADTSIQMHTWHQTSKAQKHRKRAVSRVPSCLLSPGRSPSIRRSDGRTSGHWNIWVASVLSGRATGARPFWASAPCRAIAWGSAALTALNLAATARFSAWAARLAGWQRRANSHRSLPCHSRSRTSWLSITRLARLARLRDGDPQVRIAASRPTMSCPDRTLTVPALASLVRGS